MSNQPAPALPPLVPQATHGGPDAQPFAGLDFSVNANPYGPNPLLLDAAQRADHAHYPDPAYTAVRSRLAAFHGWAQGGVVLSVGASDLLHRLVRAFVPPGGRVVSVGAPFGELARATALASAGICPLPPSDIVGAVLPGVALVYVGHPHNPSGQCLTAVELQTLAERCEAMGALLILDEAYAPFVAAPVLPPHPAVVRLLSPGKAHGLVGARPAYALAAPGVATRLDNLAPAWHLPAATASVLEALPDSGEFLSRTLPLVAQDARDLAEALAPYGEVEHHGTPYLTLRLGNAAQAAAWLAHPARGSGAVRVRDCASYGCPDLIRVATRTPADNARLIGAVSALFSNMVSNAVGNSAGHMGGEAGG